MSITLFVVILACLVATWPLKILRWPLSATIVGGCLIYENAHQSLSNTIWYSVALLFVLMTIRRLLVRKKSASKIY